MIASEVAGLGDAFGAAPGGGGVCRRRSFDGAGDAGRGGGGDGVRCDIGRGHGGDGASCDAGRGGVRCEVGSGGGGGNVGARYDAEGGARCLSGGGEPRPHPLGVGGDPSGGGS